MLSCCTVAEKQRLRHTVTSHCLTSDQNCKILETCRQGYDWLILINSRSRILIGRGTLLYIIGHKHANKLTPHTACFARKVTRHIC